MPAQRGRDVSSLSPALALEPLKSLPVPARELIAGGLSGGFAKTCVAPLERCKILFQTGRLQPGSVLKALQDIFRNEGVLGLFRGNGASVLRIVPYSALYMSAYERYRRVLVDVRFMATHQHHGRVSPVVDLVAGSAAGATAVVATYPLDLVRTRLAVMTEGGSGRGAAHAAATAPAGAAAAAAAAAPAGSGSGGRSGGRGGSCYRTYSRGQPPLAWGGGALAAAPRGVTLTMSQAPPVLPTHTAAAAAAARHSAAALPRRLHMPAVSSSSLASSVAAAAAAHRRHSIVGVLSSTLRTEGLRGMYHGIGPSLYGILPYAGLKFYMYQHLKGRFHSLWPERMRGARGNRLPVPVMLAYGATAGLVAQTVTYPLDVVRRRMQVEGLLRQQQLAEGDAVLAGSAGSAAVAGRAGCTGSAMLLRSTPQALVCIWQREGWRALFAGLSINYMKVVPSTAIGFTIYDYCKAHLDLSSNL